MTKIVDVQRKLSIFNQNFRLLAKFSSFDQHFLFPKFWSFDQNFRVLNEIFNCCLKFSSFYQNFRVLTKILDFLHFNPDIWHLRPNKDHKKQNGQLYPGSTLQSFVAPGKM